MLYTNIDTVCHMVWINVDRKPAYLPTHIRTYIHTYIHAYIHIHT